jgi:ABC-2 type transport system ATP-binding protein
MNGTEAVVVSDLRKSYRGTAAPALDGVSFTVAEGTVCGLLGPNGAGKTTALRILSTLLQPDGGRAEVAGFDVVTRADEVRRRIGLVGQHAAIDEVLSGWQNLVMFGKLYHLSASRSKARAAELLDRFDLADTGRKAVKDYSGGMRRRLDLAASLILAPPVLFLDEPTAGLDPRGRTEVWSAVRALVRDGATVLLTTQYLEEADQLADRICLIDGGRVIAADTPHRLKAGVGGDRIDVVLHSADDLSAGAGLIAEVTGTEAAVDADNRRVTAPVSDRMGALTGVMHALTGAGIAVEDIALRRPTLDEVFLRLTDREGVPA